MADHIVESQLPLLWMNMNPTIRRLLPADASVYKEIRLEALQRNPEAFGSSYEREAPNDLQWFADRLDGSHMLGAFVDGELVGTVGVAVQSGKRSHIGFVWGMFVRESARGQGIGRALVSAVLDVARDEVEIVELTVVSENFAARRLYESFGFCQYGLEKKSLRQGDRYYDEVLMAVDFSE